jgi:hypothetical protein
MLRLTVHVSDQYTPHSQFRSTARVNDLICDILECDSLEEKAIIYTSSDFMSFLFKKEKTRSEYSEFNFLYLYIFVTVEYDFPLTN